MTASGSRKQLLLGLALLAGLYQLPANSAELSTPQQESNLTTQPPNSAQFVAGFLQGSVEENTTKLNEESANTDQGDSLQASTEMTELKARAIKKLNSGKSLSAEEYRSLGVGVIGFDFHQKFFGKYGVVQRVYANSPADIAGIHPGDRLLATPTSQKWITRERENPTRPLVQVTFAREGTVETFTLIREGREVPLTMKRINIEDIQEEKYRRMWEGIVRQLGYPDGGTFTGTSLSNLEE